ncbi:MAG: hypothetical protein HYX48_05570 [Chlamydiales bacterium]|nr:hypothetical protein [Chlamydiales bacterium]
MTATTFTLNASSVSKICGSSKQAMVYGFRSCHYGKIARLLPSSTQIKKVFDFMIGTEEIVCSEKLTTLEGSILTRIPVDYSEREMARSCKAGLTNIVFENYARKKLGLPLIPILFCIDIDGNKHKATSESLTSKEKQLNEKFTHSEVRRAFKLCHTFENEELRKAAQESFKFVKVSVKEGSELSLEEIAAPWKSSDWESEWAKRRKQSGSSKSNDHPWRKELAKLIKRFDASIDKTGSSKKPELVECKEEHKTPKEKVGA